MSGHQIDPRYGVPILGTAPKQEGPNSPGLTANCEVYDSEINKIHKVVEVLRERSSGAVNYESFNQEIKDRFHSIGFVVDVVWWYTNVEGVLRPDITIQDRTERGHEFDHDQQVHEVVQDVLGLGEGGVIKTDPSQFQKPSDHGHQH